MRAFAFVGLLASCGHSDLAPPSDAPVIAPKPRLRVDRREQRIDPPRWNHAGIVGMAFCPGDRELVTIEAGGWLQRWNVLDRTRVSATALTAHDAPLLARNAGLDGSWQSSAPVAVDCSDDGTALAVGQLVAPASTMTHNIAFTIDHDGVRTQAPLTDHITNARFGPGGHVQLLLDVGTETVVRWRDQRIEPVFARPQAFETQLLAERAVYLEKLSSDPPDRGDGLYVHEGDKRIRLRPTIGVSAASVAPDGTVVIIDDDEHHAWAWEVKNGRAGTRRRLLAQGDLRSVAVTNKYFVVVAGNGTIWSAARPGMTWAHLAKPCQDDSHDDDLPVAIAMAHDEQRMAVTCTNKGVRLVSLAASQIERNTGTIGVTSVAWSPDGRLAIRGMDHSLRTWHDHELARISNARGDETWWIGDRVAADTGSSAIRLYDRGGAAEPIEVPAKYAMSHLVATSARGEVVVFGTNEAGTSGSLGVLRAGSFAEVNVPQRGYAEAQTLDLAIAADGSRAAVLRAEVGSKLSNELDLVDLASGTSTTQIIQAATIAMSRDSIVVGTLDGKLLIPPKPGPAPTDPWAIAAVSPENVLGTHGARVTTLAFSPDGRTLAAGGSDGRISLWSDGKLLGKLDGHTAAIRSLAWSVDGLQLASAGDDGAIVWDLHP